MTFKFCGSGNVPEILRDLPGERRAEIYGSVPAGAYGLPYLVRMDGSLRASGWGRDLRGPLLLNSADLRICV